MNKFENVDVLASLQQIMQQNTAAFQNDFDIDKKILTQAAKSKNAENKVYLWFSRPNGTHCLRERDVFLRGTREHNTFRFYHEQTKERVLAYAVVLSGMESGKVKGSIYELDYAAKAKLAIQTALRTDNNRLIYENGSRELPKESPSSDAALHSATKDRRSMPPQDIRRLNRSASLPHKS